MPTKTKTTALAVKTQNAGLSVAGSFGSLDTTALNDAVAGIIARDDSVKLTAHEKKAALAAITEWENDIVTQLSGESYRLSWFIEYMNEFDRSFNLILNDSNYFEPTKQFAIAAGLQKEFKQIDALQNQLNLFNEEIKEIESNVIDGQDITTTKLQKIDSRMNALRQVADKQAQIKDIRRKRSRLVSKIYTQIHTDPTAQSVLNDLKEHMKTFKENQKLCHDKAAAVKTAIAIDDKDVRNKIAELVAISVNK